VPCGPKSGAAGRRGKSQRVGFTTATSPGGARNWIGLAWLVCTVVGKSAILTPHDLWLRRLKLAAVVADGQVDTYEQWMASKGSAWANGLRQAQEGVD
jgi:hypothetical protein